MSRRQSSIFSRLRGLLDVTRLVRSESDLPTVLEAIARTISESLGFRTVVVNLYRPAWDAFQVTAVHGNEQAKEVLLGETREVAVWAPLLDARFEHRGAYLIPHDEYDWSRQSIANYVPDLAEPDNPQAWHPEDALLVPMRHTDGHLLGILSVDEPVSGRKPSPDELDVLVAVTEHAALAVQSAQEAARAARHRLALERLLDVSASVTDTRPVDEVLGTVCDAVHEALGFGKVAVQLLDPESGLYLLRAETGCGTEPLAPPLARESVDALLSPEFERDGCYLLPSDEARARLPAGRESYRSQMSGSGPHAWEDHWLFVPLTDRDGVRIGYLWADDPDDRLLPTRERLQTLRAFANQAAAALASAAQYDELRRTDERRRALIEASPLAIVDLDTAGCVRTWNPAAERIFGWRADEVLGQPLPWVPGEFRDEFEELLGRVLGGEPLDGVPIVRRRKDGRTVELSLSAAPLAGDDGNVYGLMSIVADITERRRAERALVASEARTAAVLDAALECVITIDHQGRIVEFNRSAEETFGWTSGEALGRDFLLLALPERVRESLVPVLKSGSGPLLGARLEIDAIRSDGREFPAELVLSRVAVDGPPLFTACLRDVTRRKAQDEQLRETVAKYRTLVERLPLATYVNELGWPIKTTWISPQIEEMLGFLPEEWYAVGFWEERVHPDDRARMLAEAERTHESGEAFRHEYRLIAKDGRAVWVLDETVAVRDEEYRPLFLQGFLVDISERHAAEEALRRSERLYRLVVENSTDSIMLLGLDGTILYTSPATERLTGWAAAEVQGTSYRDLVHADDVAATEALLDASMLAGAPMRSGARIRHREGGFVAFEGISQGIVDDDGSAVGMLVVAHPVAEDESLRLAG